MKRSHRLLALILSFTLLLSCLSTVSATKHTESDELEEFIIASVATGQIERDEVEQIINNLVAAGNTDPDAWKAKINATIAARKAAEAAEAARKAALEAGLGKQTAREKICADYYNQHKYLHGYATLEDVHIEEFYGYYNGVYVLLMDVQDLVYTDDMLYLSIDGLLFDFPSSGCEAMFLTYRNGRFTRVADAYEQGLLTKSNLISMLQIHYENHNHLPFSDVDNGEWYTDAVWYAFLSGLFVGTNTQPPRFSPECTLSRSMLVTLLWRSQNTPQVDPSEFFTDVAEGSWYANAVAWANQEGIVYGTGGSNFSPDAPVTRETFATMLYRLSGANEAPQKKAPNWDFKDHSTVSFWAKDAVAWAIEEEILLGIEKEDGYYLDPSRPITRAEAAVMMMRYLEGPDI